MKTQNLLIKGYNFNEVKEKIYIMIEETMGLERKEILDHVKIVDLGFDSLDAVELLMKIEKEFDIAIMDEDAEKMETLNDVFYYLIPLRELRRLKIKEIEGDSISR